MGSYVELNDTLQITKAQGFPEELSLEKHLTNPYSISDFTDKIFTFKNKPNIRIYHAPPVRVFLVENRDGKWIYWGQIHMIEVTTDLESQHTSGKYKFIKIFSPKEMKSAHDLLDGNEDTRFFTE